VQDGDVGKVGDARNRLQHPEALNGPAEQEAGTESGDNDAVQQVQAGASVDLTRL
jgi:hypothetical protein